MLEKSFSNFVFFKIKHVTLHLFCLPYFFPGKDKICNIEEYREGNMFHIIA